MGRFYKTTRATFVPNSIYTPPIELMQKAIALNEQRVDKALAQTDLFQNAVDTVKHLDTPGQRELAKQLQEKYAIPINNIVQKIHENPLDYEKYLPQMRNIQRDMMADKQTGLWRTLEENYASYKNWLNSNKEIRKTSPFEFSLMNQYYLDKLDKESKINPEATFEGGQVFSRPDLFGKKYQDLLNGIKENSIEGLTNNGLTKTKDEGVSKERVLDLLLNSLKDDPNYIGYVNQMGKVLGQKEYLAPIMHVVEKDGKKHVELNPENPFASDINALVNKYAYEKTSSDYSEAGKLALREKYSISSLAKKKKGENVDLGEASILAIPEKIVTPKEMSTLSDEYINLLGRKNLTDADNHKLAKIGLIFEPLIKRYGDDIIKAYGENPKKYSTPEAKKSAVIHILGEIGKYQADKNYGIKPLKEKKQSVGMVINGQSVVSEDDYFDKSERNRIGAAKNVLEKKFGNYDKLLAKNLSVATAYKTFGNDEESQKLLDYISTAAEQVTPNTRYPGETFYKINGEARDTHRIDIDTNNFLSGQGKDVNTLIRMKDLAGVGSVKDLIEKKYVIASYTPTNKGEVTILWTPTKLFKDIAGPETEGAHHLKAFKTTFKNLDFNPFENAKTPDELVLKNEFNYGDKYINALQNLNYMESEIRKNPDEYYKNYPDGIPMMFPNYERTAFSVKLREDGGFTLVGTNIYTKHKVEIPISAQTIKDAGLDNKGAMLLMLMNGIYNEDKFKKLEAEKVKKKK